MRYNKAMRSVPKNGAVCDIGCGREGAFLRLISPVISKGYGFDPKATLQEQGNIVLSRMRLDDSIPLPESSMDCVVMLALLEHVADPGTLVREAARVLKPGGVLVATTPTPSARSLLEFLAFRLRCISTEEIRDHRHYFTSEMLKGLFESCGFMQVRVSGFQFGFNQLAVARK